ncbi:glutamate--tRNA ligase [Rhizobacter sp. AJA081-3]|uniref:glutamate--tRNA ligase n=1 Tax=Rhizobacter sp. AJA081-3 TaxID=2753607 RepID=UPI001AE068B2|nr:glutamate--tRNA ligase [Rhizobacter sp. AJA081-3]QTN24562.1 glutamate--tRNA ligase [Rhizobacter sp. AJA081-3]
MTRRVRTRIAPSPTGFLHLGTARTALFSWAFARHHGGDFILRIEDTDVARSTQEAVDQIIAAMQWLELDYDEGPFYQMKRLDRYREVIAKMLVEGSAYHCYCTPEELDAMREAQRARGEKPRYDGRWRPEPGKQLPEVPQGVPAVIRFRNPVDGEVTWNDMVKGPITISNRELDDLIISRPDGTPTYNFCVVVDDWDMQISHVIRGDDHVNNTPRQINILRALGAELPEYGHVPMILGPDGDKLSKRHGAVSVMQYEEGGYLPEAMLNYLARLGWSHGDDELFGRDQLVAWFDGHHLARSPAQWDAAKLNWVNAHVIKGMPDEALASGVVRQFALRGVSLSVDERLKRMCAVFKDRCATLAELADWLGMYFLDIKPRDEDLAAHVTATVRPALQSLRDRLADIDWDKGTIAAAMKETLSTHGLKMPQLAPALRVLVCGRAQTPSIDAVLELFPRELVLLRLQGA